MSTRAGHVGHPAVVALHAGRVSVSRMPDPSSRQTDPLDPGAALDGTRETLRSGIWVARPFLSVDAFPEGLVLTEADRRLASKLARPVALRRSRVGQHVVELLLERGGDRSVGLSLRIPTAENQFKDPYILMEAEAGNTREIGVREVQFHLQGRLTEGDIAGFDWPGFLQAAARKLASLRGGKPRAKPGRKGSRPARKAVRAGKAAPRARKKVVRRKPARRR